MNLVKHTTREMEIWVRPDKEGDIRTCDEVHDRDIYRVKQLCESGFRPKVVVDIGGHIGTFTTLAAKYWPEARVFVFEPSETFTCLAANLPSNARAMNCAVLGFAGDEEGRVIDPSHQDEARWRQEGRGISFAQLLQIVGGKIDFLKIDCEQSEVSILKEMKELDVLKNIEVIHGEWHLPMARELVKSMLPATHELEIIDGHDRWDMFWAKRRPAMPSKHLVYTLAYGPEARRQAAIMVRSLREFGQYTGEVRVYSDTNESIAGAIVVRNVDVLALPKPHMGKSMIGKDLNLAGYDRVMFLDADIVVIRPIEPMFDGRDLMLPVECTVGEGDAGWFSLPTHPQPAGTPGFNSGTIVADAEKWNGLCRLWWEEMIWNRAPWNSITGVDQPTLNFLSQTQKISPIHMPGWIHFMHARETPMSLNVKMIHMRGPHKIAFMQCIYALRKRESLCK